jgi:predicted DNA-binding transcriptional regulator YafY
MNQSVREAARILYVLDYLKEYSDEKHPQSIKQILEYLEKQGLKTNRRTIPQDIRSLSDFGVDVVTVKSSQNLYFIGERHFQIPELRLLIDAVLSSKFITPKKSAILLNKLYGLSSVHQRAELAEESHIHDTKPLNESIYITTDVIDTAITNGKQVSFKYFEYKPDKSKGFKHNGYNYHFSPYKFLWNEDKYYVIGYSEKHKRIATFRVDRIHRVKALSKSAVPKPADFDIGEFCKRVFEMYDGKAATVELECDNDLMKVIIDKFGEGVYTQITDKNRFKVVTEVCLSPTFYGWLFQFAGRMKLLSPNEALKKYDTMLKNAVK